MKAHPCKQQLKLEPSNATLFSITHKVWQKLLVESHMFWIAKAFFFIYRFKSTGADITVEIAKQQSELYCFHATFLIPCVTVLLFLSHYLCLWPVDTQKKVSPLQRTEAVVSLDSRHLDFSHDLHLRWKNRSVTSFSVHLHARYVPVIVLLKHSKMNNASLHSLLLIGVCFLLLSSRPTGGVTESTETIDFWSGMTMWWPKEAVCVWGYTTNHECLITFYCCWICIGLIVALTYSNTSVLWNFFQ